MTSLPLRFYLQPTVSVAEQLIGAYLVREIDEQELIGRIVETEAYREDEPASHSHRGLTERTRPMFQDGGIAYVYFIYGMYHCFNVVTEPAGSGCAVLIRAVEAIGGVEAMWRNRFPDKPFAESKIRTIADGPGKLCSAFGITREDDGVSLADGPLRILTRADRKAGEIGVSRRIGIKKGTELLWRFYEKGNTSVSRRPR